MKGRPQMKKTEIIVVVVVRTLNNAEIKKTILSK